MTSLVSKRMGGGASDHRCVLTGLYGAYVRWGGMKDDGGDRREQEAHTHNGLVLFILSFFPKGHLAPLVLGFR